ncbi:PDZ domain-containing protein [bacterium]|nr:PDZ domain-containing protein [bacterium]
MQRKTDYLLPLLLSVFLALGMVLGARFNPLESGGAYHDQGNQKLEQVLGYIESAYVDTPNEELLVDNAIQTMLNDLDPYSSYIPARDLANANEQLEGNFDGIGVEFNIIKDTVTVLHIIPGGPSEKLGILPGDQIVQVEGETIAGINIKNAEVIHKLKGQRGTKVNVGIKRKGSKKLIDFTITRAEIKIESVVAVYMANNNVGYIKVTRFAGNTALDFTQAISDLQNEGAKKLIIDLRGNPGGYLGAATKMVDEFLQKGEMITYTEGRSRSRDEHHASGNGIFKQGDLCILIDEGSASASEIFSGAIQDLDRGLIVGRRSHGKGLVQEPIELSDGSQIRLTVARYYTPSGRCIQRPYDFKVKNGANDSSANTFTTKNGRTVLDGGGIIPDVVVPVDTSFHNNYYKNITRRGLLYELALNYFNNNHDKLKDAYADYMVFDENFILPETIIDSLSASLNKLQVKFAEHEVEKSKERISLVFKAILARYLYGETAYYKVINRTDEIYLKAMNVMEKGSLSDYGI